jgi:hypothetical protein
MRVVAAFVTLGVLHAAEPLRWETRQVREVVQGCENVKNGCFYAEYTLIEVTSGPDPVRAAIRAALHGKTAPADAVKETAARFREYQKKDPSMNNWYNTTEEKVLLSTPAVFSTVIEWEEFAGAAHPNHQTTYHNFNPATGAELKFEDLFQDDAQSRLEAIAKPHFDDTVGGDTFYLTHNCGLSKTGLLCTWNPFDLGARNPFGKIEIPYSEIRQLLKPGIAP